VRSTAFAPSVRADQPNKLTNFNRLQRLFGELPFS
jgi:hypothetical protein